jgi:UDP-N-acetylmuramoylalanine--D-glutamate ligase
MKFGPVFSGSRFAVLGLGKAGLPAATALRAMGAEVFVWDDSAAARAAATEFSQARPSEIGGALNALLLSPGIPHVLPTPNPEAVWALAHGVPILTDAELLYRAVRAAGSKARFAGITGTNGKSTTTALLAHILNVAGVPHAAGANLGPAALALPLLQDDGVYVLEMSSYMLERIVTLRFDVAAMLNLSPDHLDRHGDMNGYAAAKREIFARQEPGSVAVVGVDDELSRIMADSLPGRVIRISGSAFDTRGAKALPGVHNAQNAFAAFELAKALGVPEVVIWEGISTYPGLPHRQAEVAVIEGVRFINDSKATNADAASRAMACYESFVWIAGGVAKEGGIASLQALFPRIAKAFLIGRDGPEFAKILNAYGVANNVMGTLDAAVPAAFAFARTHGQNVVLFSPAAASFDQFKNFEERGDIFTAMAKEAA